MAETELFRALMSPSLPWYQKGRALDRATFEQLRYAFLGIGWYPPRLFTWAGDIREAIETHIDFETFVREMLPYVGPGWAPVWFDNDEYLEYNTGFLVFLGLELSDRYGLELSVPIQGERLIRRARNRRRMYHRILQHLTDEITNRRSPRDIADREAEIRRHPEAREQIEAQSQDYMNAVRALARQRD